MTLHADVLLTSLSLTHVQFNAKDKIAYVFAYITLAPIAIMVFYASVIVSRREVAGILMLLGQLLNEGLNAILKEYFQLARPSGHLGVGYGMPSSHAQFVWYFAAYGTIYLYTCMRLEHHAWKALAALAMIFMSTAVSLSRIYLGYHTLGQVVVGASVGIAFGLLWHLVVEHGLRDSGLIRHVLTWRLSKLVYLKDMRAIDNIAQWEYLQWEKAMMLSAKELKKMK